jgi:hypothetical protein
MECPWEEVDFRELRQIAWVDIVSSLKPGIPGTEDLYIAPVVI